MRIMLMAVSAAIYLVVPSGKLLARDEPQNLLSAPGFESLKEPLGDEPIVLSGRGTTPAGGDGDFVYFEHEKVITGGEYQRLGAWHFKCFEGKTRISADTRERTEGKVSLKVEFLDADRNNNFVVGQTDIPVKPNTVYELRGMIRTYNVGWVMSHCRISEYAKDEARPVGGGHRRLTNYPTSRQFREQKIWYATGPRTNRISLMIGWRGRPQKVGIVQQPSAVWMDDMRFVEVGPACPASGDYLHEDFEGEELRNWLIIQPGGDWNLAEPGSGDKLNPRISEERAHSGKRSLKLSGTWGIVERVFAQKITNCVVTLWFYDEVSSRSPTRMFMLLEGRKAVFPHAAGNRGVGLGAYRESASNYSAFWGPLIPCPYCGRKARPQSARDARPQVTDVARTTGWHEFKWDITEGKGIVFYIDGAKVGETDQIDGFRILQLGENFWSGFTCYVDDVSIQPKAQQ